MRTGKGDREPMDEVPPPPVPGLFIWRESLLPSPRRGKGDREAVDEVPPSTCARTFYPKGTSPFAFQVTCFRALQENLIHRLAAVPLPLKGKAYGVFLADRAYLEHSE